MLTLNRGEMLGGPRKGGGRLLAAVREDAVPSSGDMPGGGDIGAPVIADRTQHSRHQFVERGLVRRVLDIENRAVPAIRVAAIDPDLLVTEAALVRQWHGFVMEHKVFDRPRHAT
jgi:hypothetical protein